MATKSFGFDSSLNLSNAAQKSSLESSSKIADHHMKLDSSYSELIDCLKMGGDFPNFSGLTDQDYPRLSELGMGMQSLPQLTLVKKVPIPTELVEQFGLMKMSCQMGLFPEIGRAWLTIDSNIFLWCFEDGSDLAYYDGISEVILCVGLVKPKPGVFQSFIHYLLCLATPVEITLLGVSFTQRDSTRPYEEMNLLPEPLFCFPTDNTIMSCFQGADNGRIFLGGKDCCVYEFSYQAAEGWFRRKCRKINHSSSTLSFLVPQFLHFAFSDEDGVVQFAIDNSRNILYARTEKGSLKVFDLGADGNQMNRVASMHHSTVLTNAASIAKTVDKKNFSPIVHISAVEANESHHINLIAVTASGVRLYFTTNVDSSLSRPYTLALLHIRLPPGFSANAAVDRPSNVKSAFYRKGFFMLTASIVDEQGHERERDVLFSTTNDSFALSKRLIETYTGLNADGSVWALTEIPTVLDSRPRFEAALKDVPVTIDPPLLIAQHNKIPREFVVLCTHGCSIFSKPRPVDQLYKLLEVNKGGDCEAVKAFFKLHGEIQACAMCLILACSQNPQDKQIAEWATRAFFKYGGNPNVGNTVGGSDFGNVSELQLSTTQPIASQPVWSSTPAAHESSLPEKRYPQYTGFSSNIYSPVRTGSPPTPIIPNPGFSAQPPLPHAQPSVTDLTSSEVIFSWKHDALYLYFSRIIRPLWNLKLMCDTNIPVKGSTTMSFLSSTIPAEDLSSFLIQLSSLKDFIQHYHPYFANVGNVSFSSNYQSHVLASQPHVSPREVFSVSSHTQTRAQSDAELQERTSILNLQLLVGYTYEVLGLWKVLCDHQFETLMSLLSPTDQGLLKEMTFKDLIVDGKDLCMTLSSTLIKFYLDDNASTSAVSHRLREVCPSIYKIENATVSKAHEIIMNAKSVANKAERDDKLSEALRLCKSICPNLNLDAICELFREAQYYHGIVELSLCMAQRIDPQDLAVHYYKNGEPPNDQQGYQMFAARMNFYKPLLRTISELVSLSTFQSQPPLGNIPQSPGVQEPPPYPVRLTADEAKKQSELIFAVVLKTGDELLHSAVYDWLIDNNQTDTLLSVKSQFLDSYLKRRTVLHPDSASSMDLLWRFYEKNQNFSAAAKVLGKLAEKHNVDLSLSQRLEYLSRAIICIKSSEMRLSASGEGEFLHEMEEKMEVARIQLQILETLQKKRILLAQDAVAKLNSNFIDITELYEKYAMPYDLSESKLAIVHCAGHYDPSLVESLWQSIIDKELVDTCGNLPETQMKILQQKIQSLSQVYASSEKFFPLAFIIKYLEYKTCTLNFNLNWVYQTMMSVGFTLPDLLDIYHRIYRHKDTCWHTVKKPLHILEVLCSLIGEYVNNPSFVPQSERRAFVNLCLDVIAGYLVDLQAMNMSDTTVSEVTKEFKAIQHKLERLQ